jgi:hypothetical protein
MKKIHAGSGKPQGVLSRGLRSLPSGGPFHGGTHALKGVTKTVSTPASRQPRLATSWHGTVRQK